MIEGYRVCKYFPCEIKGYKFLKEHSSPYFTCTHCSWKGDRLTSISMEGYFGAPSAGCPKCKSPVIVRPKDIELEKLEKAKPLSLSVNKGVLRCVCCGESFPFENLGDMKDKLSTLDGLCETCGGLLVVWPKLLNLPEVAPTEKDPLGCRWSSKESLIQVLRGIAKELSNLVSVEDNLDLSCIRDTIHLLLSSSNRLERELKVAEARALAESRWESKPDEVIYRQYLSYLLDLLEENSQ